MNGHPSGHLISLQNVSLYEEIQPYLKLNKKSAYFNFRAMHILFFDD